MSVSVSPFGPKPQFVDSTGAPAMGNKLFFYAAGSNTKQDTYTSSTGLTANANPIVLNSLGEPSTEIWFTDGLGYKVVYAPSTDTDPPQNPIWTVDNLYGQTIISSTQSEWVAYSVAPTYVSTTSFSVPGNQTSTFQIGRRVKTTNTAGTIYSTITNSVYGAVTTVTVVNDSGTLDSGLSAVSYGILSVTNPSIPQLVPILLQTITASAATSVDFTSYITSAFKAYQIVGTDIHPGTDNVELRLSVSTDGGSTWSTSNVYFNSGQSSTTGGTYAGYGSASQTYGTVGGGRGNSATHAGVLTLKMGNLSSTTYGKPMSYDACYPQPGGVGGVLWSAGQVYWSSATAVNGVRLYMSSGTISGTYMLYGIPR